jgi:hypothetical protein
MQQDAEIVYNSTQYHYVNTGLCGDLRLALQWMLR